MSPFRAGDTLQDHAGPMSDLMAQLAVQLAEFKALKEQVNSSELMLPPANHAAPSGASSTEVTWRSNSGQSLLTQGTSPDSPTLPIMGTNDMTQYKSSETNA
jgi:hypothetical protein